MAKELSTKVVTTTQEGIDFFDGSAPSFVHTEADYHVIFNKVGDDGHVCISYASKLHKDGSCALISNAQSLTKIGLPMMSASFPTVVMGKVMELFVVYTNL